MDRDWWIKYLFCYGLKGIARIPDILVNFRLHDSSKTVSQRAHFQVEHDTFYYSLADSFQLKRYVKVITQVCKVNKSFVIQRPHEYDVILVEQALNYFLLFRANEFYAQDDKHRAQALLNCIDISLLAPADKALYKKLYFRNKYIPRLLINYLRK
jgi:hypothetical protein